MFTYLQRLLICRGSISEQLEEDTQGGRRLNHVHLHPCVYLSKMVQQQPFNGHYTSQPVTAGSPVKNWTNLLERRFLAACIM